MTPESVLRIIHKNKILAKIFLGDFLARTGYL